MPEPAQPHSPSSSYALVSGRLAETDNYRHAAWIDLLEPSPEIEQELEAFLLIGLPTREEMQEIEVSSRLYEEDGALLHDAVLPSSTEQPESEKGPVTFVLSGGVLITIRYH